MSPQERRGVGPGCTGQLTGRLALQTQAWGPGLGVPALRRASAAKELNR